jgi:hypothetical protein
VRVTAQEQHPVHTQFNKILGSPDINPVPQVSHLFLAIPHCTELIPVFYKDHFKVLYIQSVQSTLEIPKKYSSETNISIEGSSVLITQTIFASFPLHTSSLSTSRTASPNLEEVFRDGSTLKAGCGGTCVRLEGLWLEDSLDKKFTRSPLNQQPDVVVHTCGPSYTGA